MSDPKHPAKLVIYVEGGLVRDVFLDKDAPVRVFIADYDDEASGDTADKSHGFGRDAQGNGRFLREIEPTRDTMVVRSVINKKGRESE